MYVRINIRKKFFLLVFLIIVLFLYFNSSSYDEDKIWQTLPHSEKYCVIYNYWEMGETFTKNHITLVLHSTISYLYHLEKQLKTWQGGISIALLVPNPGPEFKGKIVKFSTFNLHFKVIIFKLQLKFI